MTEDLRFFVQPEPGRVVGPMSDDELREALRGGRFVPEVRVRSVLGPLYLPAVAWAPLAVGHRSLPPPPPFPALTGHEARPDLLLAEHELLDMVRFVIADPERGVVQGPMTGLELRQVVLGGGHRKSLIAPLGTEDWIQARKLFDRTLSEGIAAVFAGSAPGVKTRRCAVCRELVGPGDEICPECDEPTVAPPPSRGSIADEPEGASWLQLHWRPLITFGSIVTLIMTGITLRFVAPRRFYEDPGARLPEPPPSAPVCEAACWTQEACQEGVCVWQQPHEVSHPEPRPGIAGPFSLPPDTSDAVLVDNERFAIGLFGGVELRSTRTGQAEGLVSEAAHTRKLIRAGDAIYAIGPQHIGVLDGETMVLRKTLELGGIIRDVVVGANDRRALVSLPGAHAIAILSTEIHVELDRIRFGDDNVGPLAIDDTGKRGLTTTGELPVPGLPDAQGGVVYAFDPGRLATEQDRVRASMLGNPVSVLMAPDGQTSYVALRAKDEIVPLEWLPSGAVRQRPSIEVCEQPEQIELVRRGRRAVVRCARGKALEVLDLQQGTVARHIPLTGSPTDMVVSPDSMRVVVTMANNTGGGVAILDLQSLELELVPLTEPASRVRLSVDGKTILALSDRSKVAWIIR